MRDADCKLRAMSTRSPQESSASAGPSGDGPDTGEGTAIAEPPEQAARARRRQRRRRVLLAVLVFVVLIALGLGGLLWQRQASYNGNIDRLPGTMPTGPRPGPNVVGTENWLLVGSDTRVEAHTTGEGGQLWKPGQQRSDTLMLLHLPAERDKAYVISIPRDSWVPVPGYGTQKINAAFSYGGPPLLIQTVESLTGVRIDHFGAIDFNGFKDMTDALGGVDVHIAETVSDPKNNITWQAGKNHLDGDKALLFVRQRYNLPNGDFDRIKRQQAFLRAVTQKAAEGGTVTNPLKLDRFLSAFTKSISVDESVSAGDLRSLALSMRNVRGSDITFMTVPNKGPAARGRQSVVLLDDAKAKLLYEAVRGAEVAEYVKEHGGANSVGKVS
ncbi:cell envelope-related function transcriptional attenuator common domain-containing protein [Thermomonospora echinospora]|uniref:Cell envelope-related function transcriptional attenuator common domain-containing protein n=2 Tax=Thermomonospora echinospora TaxID=1992 RepID=A0A1H5YYU1_9ACTN|nr:cell envelope-related function transcriptional attenuator common domain-containing protein [Thermomonospora echinospora]